jgi:hypothetical protein
MAFTHAAYGAVTGLDRNPFGATSPSSGALSYPPQKNGLMATHDNGCAQNV